MEYLVTILDPRDGNFPRNGDCPNYYIYKSAIPYLTNLLNTEKEEQR